MTQIDAQHAGDAMALLTLEIIHAVFPDSETACSKLELIAGRLLDAVRHLDDGPTRDIIGAAAEVLVKSEI